MGVLEKLEDAYYALVDRLVAMGIPIDKVIGPLESRGISTFKLFLGLVLLVGAALVAGFVLYKPEHVFYFTDAYGNPLPGVRAEFYVDGEKIVLFSDELGRVTVEGKEVELLNASLPGFELKTTSEEEGAVRVVLEPERKIVKVKVKDRKTGRPVEATVKVFVDGEEVFAEKGSSFELCFSPARVKDCIQVEEGGKITFKAEAGGFTSAEKKYEVGALPTTVTLFLSPKEEPKKETERQETLVTVTFRVRFKNSREPVDGVLYIAPAGSPSTGDPIRILSGSSAPVKLAKGTYNVVSAKVFFKGKEVSVEVAKGKTFVVDKGVQTIEVELELPKEVFAVTFRVFDEENMPVEGAKITFTAGPFRLSQVTDKNGVAIFSITQKICGNYVVVKEGYERVKGDACSGEEVSVVLPKLILRGDVRVTVYDPFGRRLPGADVYLIDENGNIITEVKKTDEMGRADFPDVPVGTYNAVAEYDAVVTLSKSFEVEEDRKTEVVVYLIPQPTTLRVLVLLGETPAAGVRIAILDRRGNEFDSGETGIDGRAEFQVPSGVPLYIKARYVLEENIVEAELGPYVVPPGVDEYEINIGLPQTSEPYVKFLGVKNEDGDYVGSLKPGSQYWFEFEVGLKEDNKFLFGLNSELTTIVSAVPESERNDTHYTLSFETKALRVTKVRIKVDVPIYYLGDTLRFVYGIGDELTEDFLLVGEEMMCSDVVCVRFRLENGSGNELSPGDSLDIRETYHVTLKVLAKEEIKKPVELVLSYLTTPSNTRVTLSHFSSPLESKKIVKMEASFSPRAEESLSFYLTVKLDGKKLEEVYLGTWPVYIPELGPLKIYVDLYDRTSGLKYSSNVFASNRTLWLGYSVKDANGNYPQTGVEVTAYCNDETFTASGASGHIEIPITGCDTVTVIANAVGYEPDDYTAYGLSLEDVAISVDPQMLTIETDSLAAAISLTVSTPFDDRIKLRPHVSADFNDCGVSLRTAGDKVELNWDGTSCLGLEKTFEFPVFLYFPSGIPLGSADTEVTVVFGALRDCLVLNVGSCQLEDLSVRIPVRLSNRCYRDIDVALEAELSSEPRNVVIDGPAYPSSVTLGPQDESTVYVEYTILTLFIPGMASFETSVSAFLADSSAGPIPVKCTINALDVCGVEIGEISSEYNKDTLSFSAQVTRTSDVCEIREESQLTPSAVLKDGQHAFEMEAVFTGDAILTRAEGIALASLEPEVVITLRDESGHVLAQKTEALHLPEPPANSFEIDCSDGTFVFGYKGGFEGYSHLMTRVKLADSAGETVFERVFDLASFEGETVRRFVGEGTFLLSLEVAGKKVIDNLVIPCGAREALFTEDPIEGNVWLELYTYDRTLSLKPFVYGIYDRVAEENVFADLYGDGVTLLYTLASLGYDAVCAAEGCLYDREAIAEKLATLLTELPYAEGNCEDGVCTLVFDRVVFFNPNSIEMPPDADLPSPLIGYFDLAGTGIAIVLDVEGSEPLGVLRNVRLSIDLNKGVTTGVTIPVRGSPVEAVLFTFKLESFDEPEANSLDSILDHVAKDGLFDELISAILLKRTVEPSEVVEKVSVVYEERGELFALYLEDDGPSFDIIGWYEYNCDRDVGSCFETGDGNFVCISPEPFSGTGCTEPVKVGYETLEDSCEEGSVYCVPLSTPEEGAPGTPQVRLDYEILEGGGEGAEVNVWCEALDSDGLSLITVEINTGERNQCEVSGISGICYLVTSLGFGTYKATCTAEDTQGLSESDEILVELRQCTTDEGCPQDGCYEGEYRDYYCDNGVCTYNVVEPDEDENACECVGGEWIENHCCGDDEGEQCDNNPPEVEIKVSATSVYVGEPVEVNCVATDDTGLAWVALVVDDSPEINDNQLNGAKEHNLRHTISFNEAGTYTLRCGAADIAGNYDASIEKHISVQENTPPRVTSIDFYVIEKSGKDTYEANVWCRAEDDDKLSLLRIKLNTGDNNTCNISENYGICYVVAELVPRTRYLVECEAQDIYGESASDSKELYFDAPAIFLYINNSVYSYPAVIEVPDLNLECRAEVTFNEDLIDTIVLYFNNEEKNRCTGVNSTAGACTYNISFVEDGIHMFKCKVINIYGIEVEENVEIIHNINPPEINIYVNGDTISGKVVTVPAGRVSLSCAIRDELGIAHAELLLDGEKLGEGGGSEFVFLDTTRQFTQESSHLFGCAASDEYGRLTEKNIWIVVQEE